MITYVHTVIEEVVRTPTKKLQYSFHWSTLKLNVTARYLLECDTANDTMHKISANVVSFLFSFKWKHALTSHMITHSNDKKFLCQDCGYATAHSSVFKSHQRIHSGQTLKCGLPGCKFETIRKQNLSQHQMTHSKEKPHQCEVCGMSFSMVKNLRRHMRKHDFLAKKYKCQVEKCQFSSLRADKFMEHMKKNHSTGTELTGDPTKSVFDAINPPNKTVSDVAEIVTNYKAPEVIVDSSVLLNDVKLI